MAEWLDLHTDEFHRRKLKPDHLKQRRKHRGKFDYGHFIGWDGEGITDPSTNHHNYVFFANSTGRSITSPVQTAADGLSSVRSLPTKRILALLIETGTEFPNGIHVVYYGSYDFNMFLRDVPRDTLERLRRGHRAYFDRYNLEVRFNKRLWVMDRLTGTSVTLWDVGSFFQQSFVKSLKSWKVPLPDGVLDNIINQKANRSSFTLDDLEEVKQYCFQELDGLVSLMKLFLEALEQADIRIGQWHGPGAIAASLYTKHKIKLHKKDCGEDVNRAAQFAYGGGRVELIRQGHATGNVYNYDIRSCYPAAITRLPSLNHASWKHLPREENKPYRSVEGREFSLYCIRWNFRPGLSFYPLRVRNPDGTICFPRSGIETWCWTPEYELLTDFFPNEFEVLEAFIFQVSNPARPFTWVEDLYNKRREWKRAGYGAERIAKLGLNSLYGKMIQQQGWTEDKLPPYHQLEWGGYVTSSARAQMFRAAYGNPDVIGFETDGIFTTSPLNVELGENLGQWEVSEHRSITYVQTGFYWLDDKVRYRGFDPNSVSREMVLDGWTAEKSHIDATLTRHIGLNSAAHTGKWDDWGNWITSVRQLDIGSASNKRIRCCDMGSCRGCKCSHNLALCLHDTVPYPEIVTHPSEPYPLAWKQEIPEWKEYLTEADLEESDFSFNYG